MADETLEDQAASDAAKVKRAPPTIELEATEVSGATRAAATAAAEATSEAAAEATAEASTSAPLGEPAPAASRPPQAASISPWVVAPFSGAVAAALVILVGWMLGWPAVKAPPPAPQVDTAVVDDLGKRVASLEGKVGKLEPVMTALAPGVLQKPIKELRDDVANLRAQVDKLAAAGHETTAAPQGVAPAAGDLAPLNDRIAKLEEALRASAAQGDKAAASQAQDDLPLRRLVAAALLDVAVRHGDPFAAALATAKTFSSNPDALKPLDQFAEKGVPAPPALNRELLTLVPKLSPPAQEATTGNSIIDKLQAGASRLVRVERTDATGNDRAAIVARVTAAALRNDFADARRELATLSAEDRAPAQAWLDKVAARDAALGASRQFADEAFAALGKAAQ